MHESKTIFFLIYVFIFISSFNVFAVNDISIRLSHSRDILPCYIESATLVVEPHGSVANQSLYIEYSDHNQVPGQSVEIIHRFELPDQSIVHDLWLWIGDSVMQAKIMKVSTARQIYDSITNIRKDPAFLNVSDGQYELGIFPLISGQKRKIKMETVMPIPYLENEADLPIPLDFLKSDNNSKTSLRILFRYNKDLNYNPTILEDKSVTFKVLPDTLNLHYKEANIENIKSYNSLTLSFVEPCTTGFSIMLGKSKQNQAVSFGINPVKIFLPESTSIGSKKVLMGLDLSGAFGFDKQNFKKGLNSFLSNYLKDGDRLQVLISGEGLNDTLPVDGFYVSSTETADSLVNAICASSVIISKQNRKKPKILFVDKLGYEGWYFPGLDSTAQCSTAINLMSCLSKLKDFNIIASYEEGYHNILTDTEASEAREAISQFMKSGGLFLTYYDFNRESEKIAPYFINGIKLPTDFIPSTLTRNDDGWIGSLMPASFYHYKSCPLKNSDDSVTNELTNSNGDPVVISKPFGMGKLVVSGIWSFRDDIGQRKQINTALLGLQTFGTKTQLTKLIQNLISKSLNSEYDEIVLMSNSDKLITNNNINTYLSEIDTGKISDLPKIYGISLLDGKNYVPPIYTVGLTNYYGSGFLISKVVQQSGGSYYNTHQYDLGLIGRMISSNLQGIPNKISGTVFCSGKEIPTDSIFHVSINSSGIQYFLSKYYSCDTIKFKAYGKDPVKGSILEKEIVLATKDIMADSSGAVYTAYATQILLKMLLSNPLDTQAIMKFSIENRLLNNFTAFLALEPNDSTFFMKDPFDESEYHTYIKGKTSNQLQMQHFLNVKYIARGNLLQYSLSGTGNLEIRFFDLAGRTVLSKSVNCRGSLSNQIGLNYLGLSKGMYIAAFKFIPTGKQGNNGLMTKIVKFTIQ